MFTEKFSPKIVMYEPSQPVTRLPSHGKLNVSKFGEFGKNGGQLIFPIIPGN